MEGIQLPSLKRRGCPKGGVVSVICSYHPLPLLPRGGESPSPYGEGLGERLFLYFATTPSPSSSEEGS